MIEFEVNKENINAIPSNVSHLRFKEYFNGEINPGIIPEGVTHLSFKNVSSNLSIKGLIPNSVTHLIFKEYFNESIQFGYLPNNLTHLIFGSCFNNYIEPGVLPESIKYLKFGSNFNKPLKIGSIPKNVTYLEFGISFNKPLEPGMIPNSVTHLTFGPYFNQPLKQGVIPNSVTHLTFGNYFNQPLIKGTLPKNLKYLSLRGEFQYHDSLYHDSYEGIPDKTYLTYIIDNEDEINDKQYLNKNIIINRVNHLIMYGIDSYFQHDINYTIPKNLLKRIYDNLIISVLVDFNHQLIENIKTNQSKNYEKNNNKFDDFDKIEQYLENEVLEINEDDELKEDELDEDELEEIQNEDELEEIEDEEVQNEDELEEIEDEDENEDEDELEEIENEDEDELEEVEEAEQVIQNQVNLDNQLNDINEDTYLCYSPHYDNYKKLIWGPYQDFFYLQAPNGIFPPNQNKLLKKRKQINLLKLVHKEMVVKVFHPIRIQNICKKYHIDFVDWINIIS